MAKVIEQKVIPIDQLYVNGANVRKGLGDISELENSIEHQGILEPIIVRPGKNRKYAIVVGKRRYAAAKNVGLKTIPAIVKELTDEEAFIESAAENVHRENLSPNDEAEMYHKAYEIWKSQEKIATSFDVSKRVVEQKLEGYRLLEVFKAAKPAHGPSPKLPEDWHKTDMVSRAAKDIFPESPRKQIELFEVLKDRPRDEVKRAITYVKATTPKLLERKPLGEVVEQAFKVPVVDISMQFDSRLSRAIIRAADDRGISWEDVVRFAVEAWLKREGFL
jgi:ParB/RepB/Spo0J family partition protein